MSTVLFAWELGGNLGHLAKQLMIARTLRQRGHRCRFAVRDITVASSLLTVDGFEFVQAPFYSTPEGESQVLVSYADILGVNGFGTPEILARLVDAWFDLFGRFHPDVIVIEYSPTVLLSAKLAGIPVVRIDNGFGSPPFEFPFPGFRPWLGIPAAEILVAEQRMRTTVNSVCGMHGRAPFSTLQSALATEMDLLTTVPELDHYQGRRFGRYIGPLFNISEGLEAEWPEQPGVRIFVYLRPFEGLEVVLQTLAERSLSVIAVVPGIDAELVSRFTGERFRISASPVRMSSLLAGTDIAVTHAGHGLASACLQFGVPMLLIPQMIEQLMTSQNVERLGIGIGVNHDQVAVRFATALKRLLTEKSFREKAGNRAATYAGYDQESVLRNLADTVEGTVRRKKVTSVPPRGRYTLPLSCLPGASPELLHYE